MRHKHFRLHSHAKFAQHPKKKHKKKHKLKHKPGGATGQVLQNDLRPVTDALEAWDTAREKETDPSRPVQDNKGNHRHPPTMAGSGLGPQKDPAPSPPVHAAVPDAGAATQVTLPVDAHRAAIVAAVRSHACVVLCGETGSGKSTRVPQFLIDDAHLGCVAVTQPRRISAVSLARRVSSERHASVGGEVGYAVRFDERAGLRTRIKYVSDGMLLREAMLDPQLTRYQALVLDEAHERSIRTDLLLALAKQLLQERTDLKIIVMSATLEAQLFADYFGGAHILNIPGRLHEVRVFHTQAPVTDYVDATLRTVYDIHHNRPEGDVLAFFNGQEDIESAMLLLTEHAKALPKLVCVPLFAQLPLAAQNKVFDPTPHGHRKLVLATNLAESALTLPGVRYVIDSGLAKIKVFHPKLGLESLLVAPIAQANALQRAGRAGREAPGTVFRLYTEKTYAALAAFPVPEMLRADLSQVVLQRAALPTLQLAFLQPPDPVRWAAAHRHLLLLGALDAQGIITPLGRALLRYPVAPHVARILVRSPAVSLDLLSLVALVACEPIFYASPAERDVVEARRRGFFSPEGDLLTWLNVLTAYEAQPTRAWCARYGLNSRSLAFVLRVRAQLVQLYARPLAPLATDALLQSFLQGFFLQLAFLQPDGLYVTCQGHHRVHIHPSSVLHGQRIPVISFVDFVGNETARWYVRGITKIDPAWVPTLTQHLQGLVPTAGRIPPPPTSTVQQQD